jgi:16S rRNA C967 or C1407 C5-methylase (RsmB/RsmF family)
VRLECWGGGLAIGSDEIVVAHRVEVLAAEASTSGSSGVVLRNLVAASGMADVDHALADEPCSGF